MWLVGPYGAESGRFGRLTVFATDATYVIRAVLDVISASGTNLEERPTRIINPAPLLEISALLVTNATYTRLFPGYSDDFHSIVQPLLWQIYVSTIPSSFDFTLDYLLARNFKLVHTQ